MTRHERAAELRTEAARLRHDAKWMTAACGGSEPARAKRLKLSAARMELRAILWGWPR